MAVAVTVGVVLLLVVVVVVIQTIALFSSTPRTFQQHAAAPQAAVSSGHGKLPESWLHASYDATRMHHHVAISGHWELGNLIMLTRAS